MKYDDKTIPIECSECNSVVEGKLAMVAHILTFHPDYSSVQAVGYTDLWADSAYKSAEQAERDYQEDHDYERKLNVARGKDAA